MIDHGTMKRLAIVASAAGTLAVPSALLAQEGRGTTIVDLGTLGGPSSYGLAICSNGYVTGSADVEGGIWHTFVSRGEAVMDLGTLPGYRLSAGNDINNSGQIVGQSYYLSDGEAAVWDQKGVHSLGLYLDYRRTEAYGINDDGAIVGHAWTDFENENERPLLWLEGAAIDLGTLEGHSGGQARDINNGGTIVGASWNSGITEVVSWVRDVEGNMTALPGLGGAETRALRLNERGDIVGYALDESGSERPVLWRRGELIQLEGVANRGGRAMGINNRGLTVGWLWNEDMNETDAVLWKNGALFFLGDYLTNEQREDWDLLSASSVNERGQIIGTGRYRGATHAFLLDIDQLQRRTQLSKALH